MVNAMKKEILAVESESLGCYAQSHYLEVGKLRDNATTWYVPEFIYTISGEILADTEDSDEIWGQAEMAVHMLKWAETSVKNSGV